MDFLDIFGNFGLGLAIVAAIIILLFAISVLGMVLPQLLANLARLVLIIVAVIVIVAIIYFIGKFAKGLLMR